jgi:hypothetical protein
MAGAGQLGAGVGVAASFKGIDTLGWLPQASKATQRVATAARRELINSQHTDQDAGSTTSAMRQQYQAATDRQGR